MGCYFALRVAEHRPTPFAVRQPVAAFRVAEHRPTPCSMRQPVALRWERCSEAFGDLWDMILRCGLLSTGLRQSQRSKTCGAGLGNVSWSIRDLWRRMSRPMPCPRVSLIDACAMVGGFSAAQAYAMIATLVGRGLRPCSGKCFPLWHGVAWVRPLVASERAFGIVFGKKCVRQVVFGKCCVRRVLRLRSLA